MISGNMLRCPFYKAAVCFEVTSVCELVFFLRGGPTKMHNQIDAVLPVGEVGGMAVAFHHKGCMWPP